MLPPLNISSIATQLVEKSAAALLACRPRFNFRIIRGHCGSAGNPLAVIVSLTRRFAEVLTADDALRPKFRYTAQAAGRIHKELSLPGFLLLMLVTLCLPGCATLSQDECLTANWQTIGYQDGTQGQSPDRIESHQQACTEYGITPDTAGYHEGYAQGILIFCTPSNGFAKGKSGSAYTNICPSGAERGFLRGYNAGRNIYEQTARSNELASELRNMYNRLGEIGAEISQSERELLADSLPQEQRRRLHRTINRLEEEQMLLQRRSYRLRDEKADVDYDLNRLRRRYRHFE